MITSSLDSWFRVKVSILGLSATNYSTSLRKSPTVGVLATTSMPIEKACVAVSETMNRHAFAKRLTHESHLCSTPITEHGFHERSCSSQPETPTSAPRSKRRIIAASHLLLSARCRYIEQLCRHYMITVSEAQPGNLNMLSKARDFIDDTDEKSSTFGRKYSCKTHRLPAKKWN